LTRDSNKSHKIGCDASTLLWMGEKVAVRIDSSRVLGASYPDNNSSAEIYTNLDPKAYVGFAEKLNQKPIEGKVSYSGKE
jgi:hypothetical protein